MYELKIQDYHGIKTIDSREVAQRVERNHAELLKSIRIYCDYLSEGDFPLAEFFIDNFYKDAQDKERPCYLITKKGCDMIANKMQGKFFLKPS